MNINLKCKQWFKLDLRAARIQAAELHFSWAVSAEQLCEVEVTLFATDGNEKLNIKDENGNNKRFNGEVSMLLLLRQMFICCVACCVVYIHRVMKLLH